MENARSSIAKMINAKPEEILFLSGGPLFRPFANTQALSPSTRR